MNILQVVPFFPPAWRYGGLVTAPYELCQGLVRKGHSVTVYTTDSLGYHSRVHSINGDPVILDGMRVYYFKNLSKWLAERHHIQFTPSLIKVAREDVKGFDIIHLHSLRDFHNIVVHHYASKYGIPYVLQAHGCLETFYQKGIKNKIFTTIWGNRIARHASRLIALSDKEIKQYENMGINKEKVNIVPNGIDLSMFADLPARGNFRRKYSIIEENDKLILYLGRINRGKGIDLLVKAFAQLLKAQDSVKLAIVGPDDGYLSELLKLIKDLKINQNNILVAEPLYANDKLEAYVDADIFVLPCDFEPFGMVLLEACTCGTPVIFSKNCGLAEALNDQGGLAISYNESELLNALINILSDDELRHKLGQRGKLLVHEQFNLPNMIDKVEQLYLTCLRETSK